LHSYGWRCILLSKQLSKYRAMSNNIISAGDEKAQYIKSILCTISVHLAITGDSKMSSTRYCQSPKLQSYLHYSMAMIYNGAVQHTIQHTSRFCVRLVNVGLVLLPNETLQYGS
jgi:hypothetical protein